jgi:hypothetical protein
MRHARAALVLGLLAVAAGGTELVRNGAFELPLDSGWVLTIAGAGDGSAQQSPRYVHDPDSELLVYRYNSGRTRIDQTVAIAGTDIFFGCDARLVTWEADTGSRTWAAAAVILYYKDSAGTVLGETRIASCSEHCPWQSGPAVHVIRVDRAWHSWLIDVTAELESVPAVNPAAVRRIGIAVADTSDGADPGNCAAWAYADNLSLFDTLAADVEPEWVMVDDAGNGVLDPGETADIVLQLRNCGPELVSVTGLLRSGVPGCHVLDSLASWGTLGPAETAACFGNRFRVHADEYFPWPGDTASFDIVLFGGLAVVETLHFRLPVGDSISFPTGPDLHGEYAYDNCDLTPYAPEFNWIEVNGRGTHLSLSDDQTETVTLPPGFGFQRYGAAFTRLSICSNGWIAPGTTSSNAYANTGLPNPALPPGMIAANWDDLYPQTGNGVWWYYDTMFDWLVVEYDSVAYYGNPTLPDKFEIVIYGRSWCEPGEDNPVLCQYLTSNNYYSSTLGIQDLARSDAIQYCVDDEYAATAAPVLPGRAIAYRQPPIVAQHEPVRGVAAQQRLGCSPTLFRSQLNIEAVGFGPGRFQPAVFDQSGRLVRSLAVSSRAAAASSLVWDGCDNAGRPVPAGVYFVTAPPLRTKVVKLE